jgi:Domain of unknown function (DUF4157)
MRQRSTEWTTNDLAETPQATRTTTVVQVSNRALASRLSRRLTSGPRGSNLGPELVMALQQQIGRGRPPDAHVQAAAAALGASSERLRIHTDDAAQALSASVSARAFTVGRDVFFGRGEYNPASSDGAQLVRHELVHVAQNEASPEYGAPRVTDPFEVVEREADAIASAPDANITADRLVSPAGGLQVARQGWEAAVAEAVGWLSSAGRAALAKAAGMEAEAISDVVQGVVAAAQLGQAVAQGTTGVQSLVLPTNQISPDDVLKLHQITQFMLVNRYCTMFLAAHPDIRGPGPWAMSSSGPTGTPTNAAGLPSGGPSPDQIDATLLEVVSGEVQRDVMSLWRQGQGDNTEYIWAESGDASVDWIGVTGAISFSNLFAQVMVDTPRLNEDAEFLGLSLRSPGELVVRQIIGGTLDRSASFKTSWFDDLAINPTTPVASALGPDKSIMLSIGTNWNWDDNATTLDFEITVNRDGKPVVREFRSGTPDDSRLLGWGDGGTHHTSSQDAGEEGSRPSR